MEVKGISNNNFSAFQETQKTQNNLSKEEEKKSDKIEISSAARKIQASGKDLIEIQKKIQNGFYNSDKVIDQTAGAILKEIKGK